MANRFARSTLIGRCQTAAKLGHPCRPVCAKVKDEVVINHELDTNEPIAMKRFVGNAIF
jgi:hypothetical protein